MLKYMFCMPIIISIWCFFQFELKGKNVIYVPIIIASDPFFMWLFLEWIIEIVDWKIEYHSHLNVFNQFDYLTTYRFFFAKTRIVINNFEYKVFCFVFFLVCDFSLKANLFLFHFISFMWNLFIFFFSLSYFIIRIRFWMLAHNLHWIPGQRHIIHRNK